MMRKFCCANRKKAICYFPFLFHRKVNDCIFGIFHNLPPLSIELLVPREAWGFRSKNWVFRTRYRTKLAKVTIIPVNTTSRQSRAFEGNRTIQQKIPFKYQWIPFDVDCETSELKSKSDFVIGKRQPNQNKSRAFYRRKVIHSSLFIYEFQILVTPESTIPA